MVQQEHSGLPLEGFRMVDLGWVAAAPIMGGMLADMGVEVIKIESTRRPDTSRYTPDNVEGDPNRDPWFHSMNRGKLSLTVDFTCPEGADIVKKLVAKSDIVSENFSPGVLRRYGLDYEHLCTVNPDIIMISLSAAGQDGPLSGVVTYGPSLNGIAGFDSMVGYYDERVLGMQQPIADVNAAIHGCVTVLIALYHRMETGEGQYIDMAQIEPLISCMAEPFLDFWMNDRVAGTTGNRHRSMAPHNNYRCRGEDEWVAIAVYTDEEWMAFCQGTGNTEWSQDSRFSSRAGRLANQAELDRLISLWTSKHTAAEITEILQRCSVAATPCMDVEARYFDPHFQERQTYVVESHEKLGSFVLPTTPWKMSGAPTGPRGCGPMLGEHNTYVLQQLLGMSREEVSRLESAGVLR